MRRDEATDRKAGPDRRRGGAAVHRGVHPGTGHGRQRHRAARRVSISPRSAISGRSSSSAASRGATRRPPRSRTTASGPSPRTRPGTTGVFKTRLVVYRRSTRRGSTARWSSSGSTSAPAATSPTDWIMAHNELVRSGAAWVGVSARPSASTASRPTDRARYGSLVHPGDSYSYDIFTHAGTRHPPEVRDRARRARSRSA